MPHVLAFPPEMDKFRPCPRILWSFFWRWSHTSVFAHREWRNNIAVVRAGFCGEKWSTHTTAED